MKEEDCDHKIPFTFTRTGCGYLGHETCKCGKYNIYKKWAEKLKEIGWFSKKESKK